MDKVFGLIGLAKRAGRLVSGEFLTSAAIKDKKAKLVIIAEDASENTKKNIKDSCAFYKIDFKEYGHMEELGRFTGSSYRAVIAVCDEGFARAISEKI